ncbi:vanin-like protein 1 [Teleopsis dalmanni]|uniref:vanin-like protein 1 n=1 Tax=Teleopsis dalmanni TaxID=139649 RepID=UPI0018CF4DD5|nr:vanin-like protein 1 [Teleopsis dalmanni]
MFRIEILVIFTVFLILHGKHTEQASLPTDLYYTAGVVEFKQAQLLSKLEENLKNYINIIASDTATSTDIMVFPEGTLNSNNELTYVPDPAKELVSPCELPKPSIYHSFLIELSCAAKKYQKYLVINLSEKGDCPTVLEDTRPCASDGLNKFNTNVVFDRNGTVISRYRKVHMWNEGKNTTLLPEYGMFDTDFGVRFGHFICFDILFYTPTQELVEKYGITDFIFPTMWFSQLPFLTAVQVHAAWSFGNNVNLLAAGASFPLIGSTGSGIYAGRQGVLVAKMNTGLGERALYVATVPKKQTIPKRFRREVAPKNIANTSTAPRITQSDIYLKPDNIEEYASEVLDLNQGTSFTRELCYNNTFCCNFELKWKHLTPVVNSTYYTYRLGVFDGLRREVAPESNFLKNCAIFSCVGEGIEDCAKIFSSKVGEIEPQIAFERIVIEATFPTSNQLLIMPNSLKEDLMPVPVGNFEWHEKIDNETQLVRFVLNTTTDNLLTFSIYANYFDEQKYGKNSTTSPTSSLMLLLNSWFIFKKIF